MAATVVMLVVAAMALALVLVVLAELYCTLLLRQRRRPNPPPTATNASPISAPSLRSFYAQGVIRTPRSFLFHHQQQTASPESSTTDDPDQLMYICNPMYDKIMVTPFETPVTSPSHLDIEERSSSSSSPPLSPMKKLAMGDGPSVPSDSNTLDGGVTSFSSASASASPSW